MWNILRRLKRDEGGNVFILFGATAIPLLLFMGGAVDLARYARYKTDLSNVIDSAALALARQGEDYTQSQAKQFVSDYVSGFNVSDNYFSVKSLDVEKTDTGYVVSADAAMRTMFLPLGKIDTIGADIMAEVVHASNQVELALVLDNTGSMNCGETVSGYCIGNWSNPGSSSRIEGLKTAAHSLVDTLMTDADFVKIAVVPFEGAVNIKNASLDYSWLDWEDTPQATFNAVNFDELTTEDCSSSLLDRTRDFAGLHWLPSLPSVASLDMLPGMGFLAGVADFVSFGNLSDSGAFGGLLAWRGGGWGGGGGGGDGGGGGGGGCTTTTQQVSHKWLFDQLNDNDSSVEWAGCVEMRAEPYDILDTTPASASPDTLFVPFFWPDEPDNDNDNGDTYPNNYLEDITSDDGEDAQRYVNKYLSENVDWQWNKKDTTFPYESGPNYGCPRPILPLTNDKSAVEDAIDDMVAYYAMGTYIPTGLVWGWHALSSNAPLTEGVGPSDPDYDTTVKALVLLTDGENAVIDRNNHNYSNYSGYNYTGTEVDGHYRLGSRNASAAQAQLDTKTRTLCTNVKNAGIRLYTITFGDIPNAARTLMRNCASTDNGETLYYHAPSNEELQNVFHSIGEDLSDIHLSM
jgi:Flp pilus assembly protein TadG